MLGQDPNADTDNKVLEKKKSGFIVGSWGMVTAMEMGGRMRQRAGRRTS